MPSSPTGPLGSSSPDPRCPDFSRLAQQGGADGALFDQVAECFSGSLGRFAERVCRDPSAGADAFQDAMLSAATHFRSFRGDGSVEAWLRQLIMRACYRLRRGLKNSASAHVPYEDGEPAGHPKVRAREATQEAVLIAREGLRRVQAALDSLDSTNRSLLIEHELAGKALAELAEETGMSAEAIKARLKRSRQVVRDQLSARRFR